MSVNDVPLLNDYKKEFVYKRIPQTLLGGPNLRLGYPAPFYVFLVQILLWFLPWIISGIFTLATELGGLNVLAGSLATGCIVGVFTLVVQLPNLLKCFSNASSPNTPVSSSQGFRQLLADDDEIYFNSLFSSTTYNFIFPPLRFSPSILLHAIFSGILCGAGYWYTLPSALTQLYGNNNAAAIVVYVFSWISICIAQYPLNGRGLPPEVATYQSVDLYDIISLSRAFHIFIFYSFHIVEVFVPSFQIVNQVLHVVLLFLPVLWVSGLLPPVDALLLWAIEQVFLFGLGGSPCATDLRLFLSFILSSSVLVGACFMPSVTALILYSSALGFILSLDLVSIIYALMHKAASSCSSFFRDSTTPLSAPIFHYNNVVSLINAGWHIIMFALLAIITVVSVSYRGQVLLNSQNETIFWIIFIVLLVICKLLQSVQKVYVLFRIVRNHLYPSSVSAVNKFKSRKKILEVFGYIHMTLVTIINPLLMLLYFSIYIFPLSTTYVPSFLNGLAAIHAFRIIWQRSNSALSVFAQLSLIKLIPVGLGWYDGVSLGVQVLVLDISLDRALRFLDNGWLSLSLLISSWRDKKQRRSSSVQLILLNIIFFPIVLLFIITASVLAAPLLPLFTLPLYYVAFPRPTRFWPDTPGKAPASVCSDTSYYQQMAPNVSRAMARGLYLGVLSTLRGAGTELDTYLVRSQDKTFWIQTLESGYGYVSFSVKGLELQETSCHALEATKIDDACEAAFEVKNSSSCIRTNPHPFLHGFTLLDSVYVEGYSDAKNSLSGIIDYPIALEQIHSDFVKSLVWLLIHDWSNKRRSSRPHISAGDSSCDKSTTRTLNGTATYEDNLNGETGDGQRRVRFQSPKNIRLNHINGEPSPDSLSYKRGKANNKNSLFSSSGSLGSLLSNDEEAAKSPVKSPSQTRPPAARPPGFINGNDDDLWELESDLSDSGFGVPSKEIFSEKKQSSFMEGSREAKAEKKSAAVNQLTGWGEVPLGETDLKPYQKLFDRSWYLHVASLKDDNDSGSEEDQLLVACREMALACYVIVFVQGIPGRDPSSLGASHMYKVFHGNIPWSPNLDWLHQHPDIHDFVLKAHRYAIKMMYDRVAMGTTEEAAQEDYDDTVSSLREFDSDWFIGTESSLGWKTSLRKGKTSMFTLSGDLTKNEYSARVLIRRPVEAHIAQLSPAAVRSIWANLSLELLYATNDDEERYSIQAHPALLRNLTVQAADPPLGYPIYSSPPLYESTLPFRYSDKRLMLKLNKLH